MFICQGCGAEHTSWDGKCPSCGVTETIRLAAATDRMIDRVIKNKFKILKKLGQGGMGAVYLAEQVGIGHRVALKFLKSEFSSDPELARRFLNEAKSYARVAHPNAVALHDFGQDDEGNLFIAMEYCEGVDLKKVIAEQGRLTMVEAIEVVLQVADVLANAHEKGVVHRDLKPENIMIRRGMRGVHAKVLDFGIARLMDAGTKLTVAGAIAGTPRYMSPEQVEGREVDLRADIYSLGIVLFETLTGRQPFDGATIAEILRKQVTEPMPHLIEFAGDLDYPALDAVVQRACAKRRDARWPDMLTFADALSQATPTAAAIGLSPLQRSGVGYHAVSRMATPTPSALTTPADAPGESGIANPGSASDASSGAATLMRTPLPVGPASQLTQSAGVNTQQPVGPLPGDLSLAQPPPVAPPNRTPLVAGLVAVAVVAIGVGALALRGGEAKVDPPKEVVRPPDPPKPPDAKPPTAEELAARVDKAMMSAEFKRQFQAAVNDYDDGKLAASLEAFQRVPKDSDLYGAVEPYLTKINTIQDLLAEGKRAQGSGHCDRAVNDFNRVLNLNRNVKEAQNGLAACKVAAVPQTMDP